MKHYLNETVAFIADIHTITKIKVRKKKKVLRRKFVSLI
jgi:hypothetical protein